MWWAGLRVWGETVMLEEYGEKQEKEDGAGWR